MINDYIRFRITKQEKKELAADARAMGMTMTDYIINLYRHMRGPFARKFKPPPAGKLRKPNKVTVVDKGGIQ